MIIGFESLFSKRRMAVKPLFIGKHIIISKNLCIYFFKYIIFIDVV